MASAMRRISSCSLSFITTRTASTTMQHEMQMMTAIRTAWYAVSSSSSAPPEASFAAASVVAPGAAADVLAGAVGAATLDGAVKYML